MKNAFLLICLSTLVACANPKKVIFDESGPDMDELYNKSKRASLLENGEYGLSDGVNAGYTRTQEKELSDLFPEAANPRLSVYVFPHLSNGHPVPGYTTTLYLYPNAANFLLPGEADGE